MRRGRQVKRGRKSAGSWEVAAVSGGSVYLAAEIILCIDSGQKKEEEEEEEEDVCTCFPCFLPLIQWHSYTHVTPNEDFRLL